MFPSQGLNRLEVFKASNELRRQKSSYCSCAHSGLLQGPIRICRDPELLKEPGQTVLARSAVHRRPGPASVSVTLLLERALEMTRICWAARGPAAPGFQVYASLCQTPTPHRSSEAARRASAAATKSCQASTKARPKLGLLTQDLLHYFLVRLLKEVRGSASSPARDISRQCSHQTSKFSLHLGRGSTMLRHFTSLCVSAGIKRGALSSSLQMSLPQPLMNRVNFQQGGRLEAAVILNKPLR